MTGNIALDVVIGLVFVFLLYSLFASVVVEMIASFLGLRAKNLSRGIVRMLEEEEQGAVKYVKGFSILDKPIDFMNDVWESIKRFFNTNDKSTKLFYDHHAVKSLGRDKFFSKPSYIPSGTFSKVVLDLLKKDQSGTEIDKIQNGLTIALQNDKFLANLKVLLSAKAPDFVAIKALVDGNGYIQNEAINAVIAKLKEGLTATTPDATSLKKIINTNLGSGFISGKTLLLVNSFLEDADNDLDKFKSNLETWFDTTMDRVSGWYKRKNHGVLLIVGFVIAASFNVSTIDVAKRLSTDTTAREQMVQLASAYVKNNSGTIEAVQNLENDTTVKTKELQANIKNFNGRIDSLLSIKQKLQEDITKANEILGFFPLDSLVATKVEGDLDSFKLAMKPNQRLVNDSKYMVTFPNAYSAVSTGSYYSVAEQKEDKPGTQKLYAHIDKSGYFWSQFWGYLITALAISMGAPFWFDLLNKLVKLRSSIRPAAEPKTPKTPPVNGSN